MKIRKNSDGFYMPEDKMKRFVVVNLFVVGENMQGGTYKMRWHFWQKFAQNFALMCVSKKVFLQLVQKFFWLPPRV